MARTSKAGYAVANHLGMNGDDFEEYRYQPTRTPCPVYAVGDHYYAAKRSDSPPKTRFGGPGGWECGSWKKLEDARDNAYGYTVWQAVFEGSGQ